MLAQVVVDIAPDALALGFAHRFLLARQFAQRDVGAGQGPLGLAAGVAFVGEDRFPLGQFIVEPQMAAQQGEHAATQQQQPHDNENQGGHGEHDGSDFSDEERPTPIKLHWRNVGLLVGDQLHFAGESRWRKRGAGKPFPWGSAGLAIMEG
ncbi:hypothetical protein LP420_40670 [Massilia sp. B-10]|nr:hypothetical protein LP420_40670 [Massilia sp. B-10]